MMFGPVQVYLSVVLRSAVCFSWYQSIIVTLGSVPAQGNSYHASSFEDLVRLVSQEVMMIKQLETYSDNIALQMKAYKDGRRTVCTESRNLHPKPIHVSRSLPSRGDLIGGAIGLVYIQLYYNMEMQDIVDGKLITQLWSQERTAFQWKYQSPHSLDSYDIGLLARAAMILGRIDMEIDWLDFALQNSTLKDEIREVLRNNVNAANMKNDEVLLFGGGFSYDTKDKKFLTSKPHLLLYNATSKEKRQILSKRTTHLHSVAEMPHTKDMFDNSAYMNRLFTIRTDLSEELCKGNTGRRPSRLDSYLFCSTQFHSNHYLRLCPFKLEEKNRVPFIVVVHGFVSGSEQDQMKQEALAEGMVTTPYQVGGVQKNFSYKRSSKVAYLADHQSKVAHQVSLRIQRATSFNVVNSMDSENFSSEDFQVMNYGLGGTILGHLDSSVTHKDSYGDVRAEEKLVSNGGERIATFMMFLSSPGSGGHTIFPQLGISIKPEAGSALMWANIRSSGLFDTRVFHMGCPVLRGNKWISNKWILWNNQMASYPCYRERGRHYTLGGGST